MTFNYTDLENMAAFGVAGNFTGHLEQAGEASDFANVKTKEATAPKAIFPTYIKSCDKNIDKCESLVPEFLHIFPFDSEKIIYPASEQKIQLEPECAVIFEVEYKNKKVKHLIPLYFGASNDCSIRKEGAKKISQKKNWGKSSKGFSKNVLPIDNFSANGILSKYRIASFMIRGGQIFEYGEDSAICDYSYIFEKLESWIIEKLNEQKDEGPAENLLSYLQEADFPRQILVSIGATRYTDFGEKNFLQSGDESVVILYPEEIFDLEKIKKMLSAGDFEKDQNLKKQISVLRQKIVM